MFIWELLGLFCALFCCADLIVPARRLGVCLLGVNRPESSAPEMAETSSCCARDKAVRTPSLLGNLQMHT